MLMPNIKMRVSKNPGECAGCGCLEENAIYMFDLKVGTHKMCLCDMCVDSLVKLSVKASCMANSKVKTGRDLEVLKQRGGRYGR